MIRMIATTIRSSMSENPWFERMKFSCKRESTSGVVAADYLAVVLPTWNSGLEPW
jgi:hypothetical protein